MDDQLFLDASDAWVSKTAQLIAGKPLLPSNRCCGLPVATEHSFDFTTDQHEDTYAALLEQSH